MFCNTFPHLTLARSKNFSHLCNANKLTRRTCRRRERLFLCHYIKTIIRISYHGPPEWETTGNTLLSCLHPSVRFFFLMQKLNNYGNHKDPDALRAHQPRAARLQARAACAENPPGLHAGRHSRNNTLRQHGVMLQWEHRPHAVGAERR